MTVKVWILDLYLSKIFAQRRDFPAVRYLTKIINGHGKTSKGVLLQIRGELFKK